MVSFTAPDRALAYVLPKDLPTIEALIALHKAVKKDEDQALQRVATSFGEQSLLTKGAIKFNDVRTTLDTKLSNAHSYLVLAGAISSTANSLYQLVRDYKDFTSHTFSHVSKKPFVAWYYADANVAISREVKHCYKLYAFVAASGINLMKASMDEKLNLVMTLKTTVSTIKTYAPGVDISYGRLYTTPRTTRMGVVPYQRQGRDSGQSHQQMETRICKLDKSLLE